MNYEIIFKRILIIIVFIAIMLSWFIINLIPLLIIQFIFFRIIELNTPIYLGALILTLYDCYRKINNGTIKRYFEESKW